MEPDRAPSVQLHQWQLRRHAAAYLGAVPGGHSGDHHQSGPDRRSGPALRHVSDRRVGHQRPHADAQPGTASYLSSLELHTPPSSTRLPIDLNTGSCSLTAVSPVADVRAETMAAEARRAG